MTPLPKKRKLGEGVEIAGRECYLVQLLPVRYNLFAGIEMIYLSVYELIAKQILNGGPSPNLGGRDGVGGSSEVPRESPS